MRGVTVMEVTGAVVIFDKYHEYKYKISSRQLTIYEFAGIERWRKQHRRHQSGGPELR